MVVILALLHGTGVVPASQEGDLPGMWDEWVLDSWSDAGEHEHVVKRSWTCGGTWGLVFLESL